MFRLCLAGEYPSDVNRIGGGVSHVMHLLGETFAERDDVDFHVVTPARGIDGVKIVKRPGITIHYVGTPKIKVIPNLVAMTARIAPVLRALAPDAVNSHHCVTTLAAARAGCKVAHTIHGIIHKEIPYASYKRKPSIFLHSYLEQKAISRADVIIPVSQYAGDSYRKWIRAPEHIVRVPVEDAFWAVPPLNNQQNILFAGAVGPRKNPLVLIKALGAVVKRYPEVRLNICGGVQDQEYKSLIERTVKDEGLLESVEFMGLVDRDTLKRLLEQSGILVLPSRQETTPVVIAQAMAAGRVPIASPVGGIPGMIDDGATGFLVDSEDSEMLARRVMELLDNPDKARKMGEAAREIAFTHYNRHTVAEQILEICKSMYQ